PASSATPPLLGIALWKTARPDQEIVFERDATIESAAIVEDGSIDALHFDGYGDKEALEDKYVLTLPCQYRPSNCD
ncbi:hypothetical protein DSO57_1020826, partial [Entomophthora muscae]